MLDVIIVGAGPAGANTAKEISAQGYDVLLIERKKTIGKPVQCGEAISKFALEDMNISADHEWNLLSLKGVKSHTPNEKSFVTSIPCYSIDRQLFDQYLVDQACDQGAQLKLNTVVLGISGSAGNWKVNTNNGTFKARVIVGADGPLSRIATWLQLVEKRNFMSAFEYKFHADDVNFSDDEWLHMYWHEKFRGTYAWIFPRGNEYNIGIGSYNKNSFTLKQFCKEMGIDYKNNIQVSAGKIPVDFKFNKRAKEGAVIVGDAAALTNPVMGGGIYAALYSGKIAAETINESLCSENLSLCNMYDKKINRSYFLHPYHVKTLNIFKRWTNEDWNMLGNVFDGLDTATLTLWKMFKIGIKNPNLFLKARGLYIVSKDMEFNQKCI